MVLTHCIGCLSYSQHRPQPSTSSHFFLIASYPSAPGFQNRPCKDAPHCTLPCPCRCPTIPHHKRYHPLLPCRRHRLSCESSIPHSLISALIQLRYRKGKPISKRSTKGPSPTPPPAKYGPTSGTSAMSHGRTLTSSCVLTPPQNTNLLILTWAT